MKTHFREIAFPPVTAEQLASVGIDRSDLYWSGTFSCWRFCGETARNSPYATTGQILHELDLTPDPRA
jgi:hypothetical protein